MAQEMETNMNKEIYSYGGVGNNYAYGSGDGCGNRLGIGYPISNFTNYYSYSSIRLSFIETYYCSGKGSGSGDGYGYGYGDY